MKKAIYDRIGAYRIDKFLNSCDVDFILRLGEQQGCQVGHIPDYLVRYRFHERGQSADKRVAENTRREYLQLRKDHGLPEGVRGQFLELFARGKRQLQKLFKRGKLDVIPGKWILRKHMKEKTTFSSNIGVDKL